MSNILLQLRRLQKKKDQANKTLVELKEKQKLVKQSTYSDPPYNQKPKV